MREKPKDVENKMKASDSTDRNSRRCFRMTAFSPDLVKGTNSHHPHLVMKRDIKSTLKNHFFEERLDDSVH